MLYCKTIRDLLYSRSLGSKRIDAGKFSYSDYLIGVKSNIRTFVIWIHLRNSIELSMPQIQEQIVVVCCFPLKEVDGLLLIDTEDFFAICDGRSFRNPHLLKCVGEKRQRP